MSSYHIPRCGSITTVMLERVKKVLELKNVKFGNSFYGKNELTTYGLVPDRDRAILNNHVDQIKYVIYSYETPIAILLENGQWIAFDTYYSHMTARQQRITKNIIAHYHKLQSEQTPA